MQVQVRTTNSINQNPVDKTSMKMNINIKSQWYDVIDLSIFFCFIKLN
jgi:hypothetical protein